MKGKRLLGCLLAAAVASFVVVLPFTKSTRPANAPFTFQVELASSAPGIVQVFYDIGRGFNETDSVRLNIEGGGRPALLKFPLPPGTYRALRFDPIDCEAKVTFSQTRMVSPFGTVIKTFAPKDFEPAKQIASQEVHGDSLTITTTAGANDPFLRLPLPQRLKLELSAPLKIILLLQRFLIVYAVLLALLLAPRMIPEARRIRTLGAAGAMLQRLAQRPALAIALTATLAVIASSYPVVFLGRSLVSPNYGAYLLYDHYPTLPDYTDAHNVDAKGADVGAIVWQHVPLSMLQHRALFRDGELPLWNRYNSTGVALLGQGQSMFGDPLHFLVIMADGAAWVWDLKFLVAKWLFAFGLGLIVWRLTRHLPSAGLTALASAFIGFFVFRVNHPAFFSVCYAPWILYCWVRIVQAGSLRSLLGWAGWLLLANWAELNSGTVKEAYMLLASLNLSGAIVLAFAGLPWPVKLRTFGVLAAAGGIFALLSAPVWLTFLDTLKQSYTSYDEAWVYQIQPGVILGLFDEVFYRPLQKLHRVFCPSVNFLLMLGVLYFLATLRRAGHSRLILGLAVAALPSLSLAFGLIPADWIQSVPFLSNVSHVDNTFSCVLIIHLIPLAGVGFQTAWRRLGTPEGRGDAGIVLLLLGAMVFGYVSFAQTVHRQLYGLGETFTVWHLGERLPIDGFVWGSLWTLLAASVLLLVVARRMLVRREVTATTGLLVVLCLVVMLWRQGMHAGFSDNDYVFHSAARADFHAQSPAVETVLATQEAPCRAVGLGDNLFAGWTGVYGLEGISGPDALINRHYRELLEACEVDREWDWRYVVHPETLAALRPVYDFLNIKYYFAAAGSSVPPGNVLQPVVQADLDVYRSATPWPRAFFTDEVLSYDVPLQLAALIKNNPGHPFAAIQAGDREAPAPVPHDPTTHLVVPAQDYRLTTNSTSFEVVAPRAGIIVLQEPWLAKSFRVTMNGRPAKYFRVNHAFKGIVVASAGTYRITFTYWPPYFTLALMLCGGGVLLLGASWMAVKRLPA